MSDELDRTASSLGRILTMFQLAANAGTPAVVLKAQVESIHRASEKLLKLLEAADPSTTVHVNPELNSSTTELLGDYLHGRADVPDHLPDWMEN